jgi:hypothetical protein
MGWRLCGVVIALAKLGGAHQYVMRAEGRR